MLKIIKHYIYIFVYLCISRNDNIYFRGKPIIITIHAIKRNIIYPDQVYNIIKTGKVKEFGKHGLKFISKRSNGSLICIGEDIGDSIIIKTIERGN